MVLIVFITGDLNNHLTDFLCKVKIMITLFWLNLGRWLFSFDEQQFIVFKRIKLFWRFLKKKLLTIIFASLYLDKNFIKM
tara:strand:+ start:4808 stop:5047 length:240 start_codon:yes stop_codon:yes gene_type:complete